MLSSKTVLRGLSAVIFAGGIAACSSDSNPSYTPGTYTGGVLISGYESTSSVSPAETPFEEAPTLYGTIEIEVGEDNSIGGTLEVDELLTGSGDGPGEYDLTGTANNDGTFSFTAGDYSFEGTLNDDGTLEGTVTGPGGQEGIVGAFLIEGTDVLVACGTLYWNMDEITPAYSSDYSGNAPGVVVFNGSEFAGIFGDDDTFGTFTGEAEDAEENSWDIVDGTIDISLTIDVPVPTTVIPTEEAVVDLEGTTDPDRPYLFPLVVEDNLVFNAGFVAENGDYEFAATFAGMTSNCPGEISVE